jgi:hypothetical protein
LKTISEKKGVVFDKIDLISLGTTKAEFGHYKPIKNIFAKVLGLTYDLDSYYIYNRYDYLTKILDYEENGEVFINDLNQLKNEIFKIE